MNGEQAISFSIFRFPFFIFHLSLMGACRYAMTNEKWKTENGKW